MSPSPQPHDIRYFATPDELRDWFDANHETADELWLGYYRKSTGRPSVDWPQAVEEARFRAESAAWTDWEARPPSYRRAVTHWVTSAKQPATRVRRLDTLIADSAAGQTVGPMRWARKS